MPAAGLTSWRQVWNGVSGGVVARLGDSRFAETLAAGLGAVVPFAHSVIFGYPAGRRPVFLHDGFAARDRAASVAAYVRGTYLVDPFFEACRAGIADGVYRMEDLAPDEFFAAVGAHPGYVSPCVSAEPGVLSEEIGFFAAAGGGHVVLSLMRETGEPPFSEAEMDRLREIAPFVCAALAQAYAGALGVRRGLDGAVDPGALLGSVAEPALTPRETEVAGLVLCGHSTGAIAERLAISPSTVKIHRRNLYEKLGVGTQAELFALFVARILGRAEVPAPQAPGPQSASP